MRSPGQRVMPPEEPRDPEIGLDRDSDDGFSRQQLLETTRASAVPKCCSSTITVSTSFASNPGFDMRPNTFCRVAVTKLSKQRTSSPAGQRSLAQMGAYESGSSDDKDAAVAEHLFASSH